MDYTKQVRKLIKNESSTNVMLPYPHIDGGCIGDKNISQGLIDKFDEIKILTISTKNIPLEEFLKFYCVKLSMHL